MDTYASCYKIKAISFIMSWWISVTLFANVLVLYIYREFYVGFNFFPSFRCYSVKLKPLAVYMKILYPENKASGENQKKEERNFAQ